MADRLLLEDGTSVLLLEGGAGALLLEGVFIDAPFIASTSVAFDPALTEAVVLPGFIASTAVAYSPALDGPAAYITFYVSTTWTCPVDVYSIKVEATGAGAGGGGDASANGDKGGGAAGAYASNYQVPVTPGTTYTITVGTGGIGGTSNAGGDGADSSFVGDGGTTVAAASGKGGTKTAAGAGGTTAASTGLTKYAGGSGGAPVPQAATAGAGGGEAAGPEGAGDPGDNSISLNATGRPGGSGLTAGGDGGRGGDYPNGTGSDGNVPGGGGGGGAGFGAGGAGAHGQLRITFTPNVLPPFISSTSVAYAPTLQLPYVDAPFIASVAQAYAPTIYGSSTGPGNGGETFPLQLAAAGVTVTATLDADLTSTSTSLSLTGTTGLPASGLFCLTVDDEVMSVARTSSGVYRIYHRGLSNTIPAAHAAGASAAWDDTYLMAVESEVAIAANFTYDYDGLNYNGWLVVFDSSQAYLGGSRYATRVAELEGVFPPGGGFSKCDSAQPAAVSVPVGVTEDCPASLTVPALLLDDVDAGDVALFRYTNAEAAVLTLGPRSAAAQAWYGFLRVDDTNVPALADPAANVIDGTVQASFYLDPFVTTTLLGDDRTFTYGAPRYSDKGWPFGVVAVRQGTRRVPHWTSPDWHDFNYVYSGFSDDATFVQIVVNRNGLIDASPDPAVALPGPQDIAGPNATWDDNTYRTSTAWYVGIFSAPFLFIGPVVGGPPPTGSTPPPSIIPIVEPPATPGSPPPYVPPVAPDPDEGGSGGGIPVPGTGTPGRFWVALV